MGWKKTASLLLTGWIAANTSFRNDNGELARCIGVKPFGDAHEMLHKIGITGAIPPKWCPYEPETQKSTPPTPSEPG